MGGWYYWAERRRPSAEQVKILAALADTTAVALENVRIFEELRQKNQDMTALMQAAPIGVVSLGADAQPNVWNPAAAGLFGDPITLTDLECLSGIAGESAEDYCRMIEDLRQGRVVRGKSLTGRRHRSAPGRSPGLQCRRQPAGHAAAGRG
ncbi:hypothetical protein GALL_175550 [mine drainage metagenome]|uniref:Uncharacterized protein n=1 Tax=mine drainage metagenome TaxID=410659 RepID=A0A1J5RWG5_9ZZZZ